MCGIFGAMNLKLEREKGISCLNRLSHRGPDGWGFWQEEGMSLGHRRLSVLDLSEKGKQPMTYGNGRYVIVFNGEIYNFIELRKELKMLGYSFKSESDTEVALASFIQWKEKCLLKWNGMWALAIWDRHKKELFFSRDRFGIKPLYYTEFSGEPYSLAFGSEMKALLPLLKEIRPNASLLTDTEKMLTYEGRRECVIEGILRFPAGCYAYGDKRGLKIKRYWRTLNHLMEVPKTYEEQVEKFRELFLHACKIRMRSDVTIGTALSGGLDSSATICAMSHIASKEKEARLNKDWQHAYVAAFPGTTMDESAYAKKVTDYLGMKSTFVNIEPLKAVNSLEHFLYLFEDVYVTSPIPMMLLYGELKRDGTVVTIDGHGADELFGGYTFDFLHALKDAGLHKEKMDKVLNAYIDSFPADGSNIALKSRSKGKLVANYYRREITRGLSFKKKPPLPMYMKEERFRRLDHLNKKLYMSTHETILPTLLRNYDRYSMANGVEIRMPFMDYRIVSFAFSIGWESKLHGGYSKSIIRDAMAPFMPKEIAYRKTKIGFNTPIVEWMKGPLKEYFLDLVHEKEFAHCGLIRPKQVRRQVIKVIKDPLATFAMGEEAWKSLYPYLWEKAVLKRR